MDHVLTRILLYSYNFPRDVVCSVHCTVSNNPHGRKKYVGTMYFAYFNTTKYHKNMSCALRL